MLLHFVQKIIHEECLGIVDFLNLTSITNLKYFLMFVSLHQNVMFYALNILSPNLVRWVKLKSTTWL
jgi:hypothetical protein